MLTRRVPLPLAVVHSEMPSDEVQRNGGTVEGFQLWVNLPSRLKMCPPNYQVTTRTLLRMSGGLGSQSDVQ